jgi:hypothetical protein
MAIIQKIKKERKPMKKLLAIVLTLALALCLAVPAFAAESSINADNGTASVKVNGTYTAGSSAAEVISVDVSWGSMSFTYHDTVEGSWNDETHNFDNAVAAYWTCETDANKMRDERLQAARKRGGNE